MHFALLTDASPVVRADAPASATRGRIILAGALRDVSLAAILQLALFEVFNGWIEIEDAGVIGLRNGHVVDARCAGLQGIEALRELLFRRDGDFTMVRGQPPIGAAVENVTFAVVDAYRLRDEWARVRDLVLRPLPNTQWKPTGGLLDHLRVHLDGRRRLAEIVREGDPAVTLVVDAIVDALELGLLERVAAPEPVAAPAIDEVPAVDHYELLDRGRARLRAGDLDAAEADLRRALALCPGDRVILQNLAALALRRV